MALKWPDKDPEAFKDYGVDWTALLESGETLDVSTWAVTPAGELTTADDSIIGNIAVVWLGAGEEGTNYKIVNTIETSRGVIDERTVTIKIKTQ